MILQGERHECGLACLANIFNLNGIVCTLQMLRERCPDRHNSIKLTSLINLCDDFDVRAQAVRIEVEDLRKLKFPVLLHWDMNHYVVLEKVYNDGSLKIIDPAVGRRRVSADDVDSALTGIALIFDVARGKPNIPLVKQKSISVTSLIYALKNTKDWEKLFFLILFLGLSLQLTIVLGPIQLQKCIDAISNKSSANGYELLVVGYLSVLIGTALLEYTRRRLSIILSSELYLEFTYNVISHLFKLPANFFRNRSVGQVTSRIDSIADIQRILTEDAITLFVDSCFLIVAIVMLIYFNSTLAAISIFTILVSTAIYIYRLRYKNELEAEKLHREALGRTSIIETLTSIEQVKVTDSTGSRISHWLNQGKSAVQSQQNANFSIAKSTFIKTIMIAAESATVLAVSVTLLQSSKMSLGVLIGYFSLRAGVQYKLDQVLSRVANLGLLEVHFARLHDLLELPVENNGTSNLLSHDIQISNLSMDYSDNQVFKNVNLEVNEGCHIAITGKSGVGKTTLLRILQGTEKPTKGKVLIGGVCVSDISPQEITSKIGVVLQGDQSILEGTIADNISMFDPVPDIEWIEALLRICQLEDYINGKIMGINSLMSGGECLSGGQMQRFVLARALYKRPKILLLDEATSHLDFALESSMLKELNKLRITIIHVAHRRETLEHADQVFRLTEHGIHLEFSKI